MRRISIDALNSSREEVFRLRDLLGNGGMVAVPTETYYAFAADPFNEAGVERVFQAKGRDTLKALSVLFATREQLERFGVTASAAVLETYFRTWPAPLTVVFPIRELLAASRGGRTLAVRMPADPKLCLLLQSVGPLTGTSVNRSGSPPLDDPDAVEEIFRRELDALVDGGRTPGGEPSTIVDATGEIPRVLRAGAFVWPITS